MYEVIAISGIGSARFNTIVDELDAQLALPPSTPLQYPAFIKATRLDQMITDTENSAVWLLQVSTIHDNRVACSVSVLEQR